ncbi:DUF3105 domain-containing protein [Microbacterium sp. SORGH_AS_0862]|uniref:DUF3105 domain-containing protein n=1 Tax=Microbacterium sp. SORGH_AS_0862 TaxID=3041789 RepID=UPI002790486D|nr:DUF3105 domain-containing protein [Microbacterium sp. SORGH_AS_0862]MDQ1205951.1 hypothetical protein [Microbacterium sp. SORGH_AS_0862]
MTPTPDKRQSGNPATQAKIASSQKQEREQRRQEKLAEYQRQLAKRRRSKLVWWVVGSGAAVVVVALVVASIVFTPKPVTYGAQDSTGAVIEGVETFSNTTNHVEGPVEYPQTPPAGGEHNPIWLNCGIYTEPVPNENAVHSMEHGAVWVTYDPARVGDDELATLKSYFPQTYTLLSPYEGLDSPIVLSAWNAQLKLDTADDTRIPEFFEEYWRSQNAPEPNAVCSGGVDAPGRQ